MRTLVRFSLVLGSVALGAPAQVTFTTVATTGITVQGDAAKQTVPPNTDITAGVSLSATGAQPPFTSRASFDLKPKQTPDLIQLDLTAQTNPALVSMSAATITATTITLTIQAAVPTQALVEGIFYMTSSGFAYGALTLDAGSAGQYQHGVGPPNPVKKQWKVTLTPAGTVLRLGCWCQGGFGMGGTGAVTQLMTVTVRADPDVPLRAVPFGTACGATLAASTEFSLPGGTTLTLSDPRVPLAAWLLLGDQKVNVPLPGGCTLYDNLLILLPIDFMAPGTAAVFVVPPPIPSLYVVVQGATWDGATLRMSQGLELFGS